MYSSTLPSTSRANASKEATRLCANDYLLELCATRCGDVRKEIAGAGNTEQGFLTDLIEVCYGKDHKKLADGTYPVYGSSGLMRHVEKYLHEGESVLIPRKGTLNNVSQAKV